MRVIRPKSSPKVIRATIHRDAYAGLVIAQTPPIPALLTSWTEGPAAAVLTWYGPESERVELTGRVLANWVTKATNLLQQEADVEAGSTVGLDLPVHWRTLVWALAAWNCGAEVVLPEWSDGVDVQVSATPSAGDAPLTIAIALPALARQVEQLPAGAIDGAAELMSQPDVLILAPDWQPDARALEAIRHSELADPHALWSAAAEGRILLTADSARQALPAAAATWLSGGSVILVGDHDADVDRIAMQEGADRIAN